MHSSLHVNTYNSVAKASLNVPYSKRTLKVSQWYDVSQNFSDDTVDQPVCSLAGFNQSHLHSYYCLPNLFHLPDHTLNQPLIALLEELPYHYYTYENIPDISYILALYIVWPSCVFSIDFIDTCFWKHIVLMHNNLSDKRSILSCPVS